MAGSKFQYDESGGTFFYFLLSFLALIVIPSTYYFWPKKNKRIDDFRDRKRCQCEQCLKKINYLKTKEPWQKAKERAIRILLISGWLAMLACAYKVAHLQHDYINWDPFEILGIDPGSSTAEIKKAYRRLSLIYHPDKETGDERKFMKISKAYAALTDDEARENWEKYGNPDGPGATSFGIALPSWIVEKENSILVLGLYALVFMIALPTVVGIWWYRSVKYGGDQVLLDTTQMYYYFIHKNPHILLKRVIMIISASLEFERSYNNEIIERPQDNFQVPQLIKELSNLNEKNKERPLCYSYSIKARALLHAHLTRLQLPSTLETDKMYIIKKCPYLIQEFVHCTAQLTMLALAGRISKIPNLETLETAMKLSPLIVQALWDSKNPLLQLPHINDDLLRHFTTRKRNVRTLKMLASMKNDDRRSMLRNLSDDQYEDIMNVMNNLPMLELDVRLEVLDDEDPSCITSGAIVTVTVKLTRKPLSTQFEEPVVEVVSVKEEVEEINENEVAGSAKILKNVNKPKIWEKQGRKGKKGGKDKKNKKKQPAMNANKKPLANYNQQNHHQPNQSSPPILEKKEVLNESDEDETISNGNQSDASNGDDVLDEVKRKEQEKMAEECSDEEEWDKVQSKVSKKDKSLESKPKKSHSVHCPYFPEDKQEYWWIYLMDRKKRALLSVPVLLTCLEKEEEVDLKFTAPQKIGTYYYSVVVKSDSYLDLDVVHNVKVDVNPAREIPDDHPQWDISDEEEEAGKEEDSAVEDSDLLATDDESETEDEE